MRNLFGLVALCFAAVMLVGCEQPPVSSPSTVSGNSLSGITHAVSPTAMVTSSEELADVPVPNEQTFTDGTITVVFNPGNNPGSCSVGAFGGQYQGSSTTIIKDGSLSLFTCHAKLVSGTPVDRAQKLDAGACHWEISPGGTALISCPAGF